MAKRGDPAKESYRVIEPGESLEARIDLAEGYDVSRPGTYTVAFEWRGRGSVFGAPFDAKGVDA
jgi:hypothetical protein